jgi:sec-independent protein translocase protein TatC
MPEIPKLLESSQIKSLLGRADEFRSRIVRATVVLLIAWTLAFLFAKDLLLLLKQPLLSAMPQSKINLHFTGPLEVFVSYLHVSFLGAFIGTMPYTFYQLWVFTSPVLSGDKRKFIKPYFIASLALFASGMAFCYFAMLPQAFEFLVGSGTKVAIPLITVGDYTTLVVYMMLGMGLVSELPIVLILLVNIGFLSLSTLKKGRRPAVVIILIIAAIVTPTPDPVSQLIMAVPMYILYEAAILVIQLQEKN